MYSEEIFIIFINSAIGSTGKSVESLKSSWVS